MDLAQELVDYIIDLIHDDPATLLQVSLVSKAWVYRTRAYLCKSLKITHSKLISSDPSYLGPLGRYIKTLQLEWPGGTTDPSVILDCFKQSEPHALAIHSCELRGLDEQTIRRYFAKFPCTSITALELHGISANHGAVVILLSLFPNIDDLTISVAEWDDGSGPVGSEVIQRNSTPRLRGSLKCLDPPGRRPWSYRRGNILYVIAALPLQFQTVSVDYAEQSREVSTFLRSCSKTVRKVFIGRPHRMSRPHAPSTVLLAQCEKCIEKPHVYWPDLSCDFANLEELRIGIRADDIGHPQSPPHPALRLFTSRRLQRVIIEVGKKGTNSVRWPSLDESLVNLVGRHKTHGIVELHISTTVDPEVVFGLLPRVAQEGVLRVGVTERPDYCAP